jgi:hypothetical protein
MVSILYRVHQNLMFLGEKNWANRYAPATNKKTLSPPVAGFFIARRDSL